VLEIHVDTLLPVLRRHFLEVVPVVVRRVVHEDRDRTRFRFDVGQRGAERRGVRHVALQETGAVAELRDQGLGLRGRDVEEEHAGVLARESRDDLLADAGAATGDDHRLARQRGVNSVRHIFLRKLKPRCS
jgi:hypothetical protein